MRINPAALKQWRTERGLSISALADAVGMPQPNLSKMEAGEEQPSWGRLARIAKALGISPAVLIGPDPDPRLVDEDSWPFQRGRRRKAVA
jgi:transcriptional regulator with XRE-family HTH domain